MNESCMGAFIVELHSLLRVKLKNNKQFLTYNRWNWQKYIKSPSTTKMLFHFQDPCIYQYIIRWKSENIGSLEKWKYFNLNCHFFHNKLDLAIFKIKLCNGFGEKVFKCVLGNIFHGPRHMPAIAIFPNYNYMEI